MNFLAVQGIAWFPEKDKGLLEALQRWAVVMPHMLLFHCCQGYNKDQVLSVCQQAVLPDSPQLLHCLA